MDNILNLSKIFIRENNKSFNFIDWENKKINKYSFSFFAYILVFCALTYLSSEIISFCNKTGKPEIFLSAFFLIFNIMIIFRTIILSINIFYFSEDIQNILFLPVKPIEILIAKLNTVLFMNYEIFIMGIIPLVFYAFYLNMGLMFLFKIIILFLLFPIFFTLIVSSVVSILMKTIRFFRNKDLMQIISSFILIFVLVFFINKGLIYVFNNFDYIEDNKNEVTDVLYNKINNINKYFLNINPVVNILNNKNVFLNLIKLIFLNIFAFFIFMFLGKTFYLKQLLKTNFYVKNKTAKKLKSKKRTTAGSYIRKEFATILKNPLFVMHNFLPPLLSTITTSIFLMAFVPKFIEVLQMEQFKEMAESLTFNIEAACLILGLIQVLVVNNFSSITCFSRDGKSAFVMKYLPVDLYKQFIYKNIPQIFINTFCSCIILGVLSYEIRAIEIKYIVYMFVSSVLMFCINSFILSLIDLLMPKINWDSEYEVFKNNKNKILQYVLLILNILFFVLIKDLFEKHNLEKSLIVFIVFLFSVFIILNFVINKYKNKIFKKIN